MYRSEVSQINNSLKKTGKAIIGIGCSFVDGQGAVDQDLYDSFEWTMDHVGIPMAPKLSYTQRKEIVAKYPDLLSWEEHDSSLIWWYHMERKNAFVSVLANKYFDGEYTPINFGLRGNGNRASIKSLYLWPQIDWHLAKEIIVIYMPTGMERLDFVNDFFLNDAQFQCAWPNPDDQPKGPRKTLWKGYAEAVYSEKQAAIEQLIHVQDLLAWCKLRDAKLIITPAFDRRYTHSSLLKLLNDGVVRKSNQAILEYVDSTDEKKIAEFLERHGHHSRYPEMMAQLVDAWPWESMFYPNDAPTMIDFCMNQEGLHNVNYWTFNGKGTPDNWITTCCHPSAKAHDLYASKLYTHITEL